MAREYCGEYGGRVIRKFNGGGKAWIAGATLNPEDVENWPVGNRNALSKSGHVEWYGPPREEETKARGKGKPKTTSSKGKAADSVPPQTRSARTRK